MFNMTKKKYEEILDGILKVIESKIDVMLSNFVTDQKRKSTCEHIFIPKDVATKELLEHLAVMHGDGGHYVQKHGLLKAIQDASTKYYDRLKAWDKETFELKVKVEKLNNQINNYPNYRAAADFAKYGEPDIFRAPFITIKDCMRIAKEMQDFIKPEPKFKPGTDNVNSPPHYTDGKIEVIEFIEDKKLNFKLGNAVKYISRAGKKDPTKLVEDLEKARWYLDREIHNLKIAKQKSSATTVGEKGREIIMCPKCKGKGNHGLVICYTCNGTGTTLY